MNKFTFICTFDYEGQPAKEIIHTTDGDTLPDVCEAFQDFLRGCGYHFDGEIEVVPNEEIYGEPNDGNAESIGGGK